MGDELGDAEWVPHQEEQNQKPSLSTSRSRVNMRNKHRKGRSRKPLEEIDDKAKKKNVVRCRKRGRKSRTPTSPSSNMEESSLRLDFEGSRCDELFCPLAYELPSFHLCVC